MIDAVVGLQWGSEGKGKVVKYIASEYNAMIRSGGPQAGHTFYDHDIKYVNRLIPCGVLDNCLSFISAGGIINLEVLVDEIQRYQLYPDRLMIDSNAMVVTEEHIDQERMKSLTKRIGSTGEGVGAAQADKIWRTGKVFDFYAHENPELYFYCGRVADSVIKILETGAPILLEGTQGFGLCLNHGSYPYCTSRDVLTSSLLSDAGIPPKFHDETIGVLRTYPIRVGGNSGPAGKSDEITWEEITSRSRSPKLIQEYTTVTGRLRRVFEQDFETLDRAISLNGVTQLALMFIDYINYIDYGKRSFEKLSKISKSYVLKLEDMFDIPVTLIGTGPKAEHIIDRRPALKRKYKRLSSYENNFGFKSNFNGYSWSSGYIERFLERKLGWSCNILTWNNKEYNYDN